MAFREKIAWVSLAGIVIAFAPYFALIAAYPGPEAAFPVYSTRLFIAATMLIILLTTVGAIGTAITATKDAQAPADERDRDIARQSSAIGYAVLLPLLFCVLAIVFLGAGIAMLANAVLAAIVIAEITRYGSIVLGYRQGWHG